MSARKSGRNTDDEAHNVCPQNPTDPNQALATEHVVRIAGEGRKHGLYLFLSTQRPSKVHQNVLSQCDNLILMKMNSAIDIRTLVETFSYAPASLVERAAGFGNTLTYTVLNDSVSVDFVVASSQNTTEVAWHRQTGEGYIIAPNYKNGSKSCWDGNQDDLEQCPN